MQVSFTGIKNTGFLKVITPSTKTKAAVLNMQLTDDYNGNDLSEFKKLIKVPGFYEKYINELDKEFVNIVATYSESEYGSKSLSFYLNGSELKPQRKTMPLYTFLAKITRNFANTPKEKCIVNSDYLASDKARYGIYPGVDLRSTCESAGYEKMLSTLHSPEITKKGALIINDLIQEKMMDYLV